VKNFVAVVTYYDMEGCVRDLQYLVVSGRTQSELMMEIAERCPAPAIGWRDVDVYALGPAYVLKGGKDTVERITETEAQAYLSLAKG
jgi:hypothetical protein